MCDVRKEKTLEIVPIYYYCLGCMLMFCSCAIYCTKCIANKHDFTCQSCVFRMYTDIVGSVFYVYGKNLSFHVVEQTHDCKSNVKFIGLKSCLIERTSFLRYMQMNPDQFKQLCMWHTFKDNFMELKTI